MSGGHGGRVEADTEAVLQTLLQADRISAHVAAYAFLSECGMGMPDVPLVEEQVRSDASIWAACAAPHELEAYIVAAVQALERGPLVDNQLKRLGAMAFKRMNEADRERFKAWMTKQ